MWGQHTDFNIFRSPKLILPARPRKHGVKLWLTIWHRKSGQTAADRAKFCIGALKSPDYYFRLVQISTPEHYTNIHNWGSPPSNYGQMVADGAILGVDRHCEVIRAPTHYHIVHTAIANASKYLADTHRLLVEKKFVRHISRFGPTICGLLGFLWFK